MKTLRLRKQHRVHGNVWGIALLLCTLAAGGCTKGEAPESGPQLSDVPILVQGSVGNGIDVEVENGKRAASRAPIEGGAASSAALNLSVVRADETNRSSGLYGTYSAVAIQGARAAAVGNTPTALVLTPAQFYPINERNTRFTGWHPQVGAGSVYSGGVVTFTFDGSQDIMTAPMVEGNSAPATLLPNLVFAHRLSQVRVWVYAADLAAGAAWGKVKAVKVLTQRTGCTYTPATDATTGKVTFTGAATSTLTVYDNAAGVSPGVGQAAAVQAGESVMIEPQGSASYVLTLEVAAEGSGATPLQVSLNPQGFEPSKAYNIYLKLTSKEILPTATISDWGTPTDSNVQL